MKSSLIVLIVLVPLLSVGLAHGQTGEGSPSTLGAPPPAPVLSPTANPIPAPYAHPPGFGGPRQYPRHPQARSQFPYPTPTLRAAEPPWQEPTGWLRLGANVGIFPLVGRLRYSFVYHGEVLDTHYGPAMPRPGVSIFAEAQPSRFLFLGLSVQFIALKWTQNQGVRYDNAAYEFDFLARLGLSLPASSRFRLLVSGAPGYSIVDISDVVLGTYAQPSPLRGFVVQADAEVLFLVTQHHFVQAGASVQWGFQNNTLTSKTTNLPATAEVNSTLFGLHTGMGYWF